MTASRNVRIALTAAVLALIGVLGWCAWQAWQANRDLQDAVTHADAFQDAVEEGDETSMQRELTALRTASASAEARTSGITWSLLSRAPVIGDDARGVRTVSRVVHDLATTGLEPLIEVQDRLPDLLPRDGVVRIDEIAALEAPVATAEAALRDAEDQLDAEDTTGFTTFLSEKYADLRAKVSTASHAMTSARIATDLLPGVLGADGDRTYLLVFQNNAEIRATGGLPGAVSVLHAADGKVEITRQVAGADLGRAPTPPLALTEAEHKLYDDVLGAYFLSSNMTPDFPRVADLWIARWRQVHPADRIDGVLTMDTVSLSYLLEATGPITVDGVELTSDNVVDELLHDVYLRIDDPEDQDDFFADVAQAVFERFLAGASNPTGVIQALARATDEGRLHVHLSDAEDQSRIAGTRIAGELITDPDDSHPQINVTVNDTTAAKMSYYLRYETDISATYCIDGVQGFSGKMRLTSIAPKSAGATLPSYVTGPQEYVEPGDQLLTVRIYGPTGGSVHGATLNNKPLRPVRVVEDGRPVAMFFVQLAPGQTADVAWSMRSGQDQTAGARVAATPGIQYSDSLTTLPSACRS